MRAFQTWLVVATQLLAAMGYQAEVDTTVTKSKAVFTLPKIQKSTEPVKPDDTPKPAVDPNAPVIIRGNQLYPIQSDTQFILLAFPEGLVTLKHTASPLNAYGTFIDGNGEDEERTFSQSHIAIVRAVAGKSGRVELALIPEGAKSAADVTRILIDIGVAPQPPPKPDEPDTPPVVISPVTDAFKAAVKSITANYAGLPAADRPKLAAAFREAAVKTANGEVANIQQLTKVTADLTLEKMGLNAFHPWVKWRDEVTVALKALNISDPKDHVKPWNTIADVLENK